MVEKENGNFNFKKKRKRRNLLIKWLKKIKVARSYERITAEVASNEVCQEIDLIN